MSIANRKFVTPREVFDLVNQDSVQLIDVRSHGEYLAGHVPGALNVPLEQIEARLDDVHNEREVILICQSGNRAQMACELIAHAGKDLTILEGGTSAWQEAGFPVVAGTSTRWSLERQVRLMAGLLVFAGIMLSLTVHPNWIGLSLFVSLGLMFAGLTDICPMGMLFAAMPWNKGKSVAETGSACA